MLNTDQKHVNITVLLDIKLYVMRIVYLRCLLKINKHWSVFVVKTLNVRRKFTLQNMKVHLSTFKRIM